MKTKNNPFRRFNSGILPAILLITFAFSSCAAKKRSMANADTPFVVVEEMPVFPGGDSTLLAYIASNTKYPEKAKTNNIQGRVITRFCVTREGGIDRVSILRGVDPELDNEAIRVVSSLPLFKPGKQGGKAVNVWYMVPITFSLGENKTDSATVPEKQK